MWVMSPIIVVNWRRSPEIGQAQKPGIVALDCSRFIRPEWHVLPARTSREAGRRVSESLEREVLPAAQRAVDHNALGLILFARVPAITPSPVLSPTGRPYLYCRPESCCQWLIWPNPAVPVTDLLQKLASRMGAQRR